MPPGWAKVPEAMVGDDGVGDGWRRKVCWLVEIEDVEELFCPQAGWKAIGRRKGGASGRCLLACLSPSTRGVLFEVVKRGFCMQSNKRSRCSDSEIRDLSVVDEAESEIQGATAVTGAVDTSCSTLTYAPRYTASELPLGTCGSPGIIAHTATVASASLGSLGGHLGRYLQAELSVADF